MTLIEQINQDFIAAYKESKGNEAKKAEKDFLGLVKSTLTKDDRNPSDQVVIAGLKNLLKKNNESIEEYGKPTMTDAEIEIVNKYLPRQMSETELFHAVQTFLDENAGANMGQIMGFLKDTYGGKYDAKTASNIVKSLV